MLARSIILPPEVASGEVRNDGDIMSTPIFSCSHYHRRDRDSGLHAGKAHWRAVIVQRGRWGSLVAACVIDVRDSTSGMHECSISFLCRPGRYTDTLRAQLSPPGEVYGMSSTPETGRLACTSAVSRFNAARGSIPICYARSYRRLGKYTVCHRRPRQNVWRARVQYLVIVPHRAVYRSVTLAVSTCRGSVRYARAKDARHSVSGSLECSILVSPPGARCPV